MAENWIHRVGWDAGSRTVTVTSGKLTLTAVVGQQYVVANGAICMFQALG
ncbi:MAG: hypothetical protein ACLT5P_10000 [Flavonifractor plautii]